MICTIYFKIKKPSTLTVEIKSAFAHQTGVYPSFLSMKRLVFLPPPPPQPLDGMLVYHRVTPSIKFIGTLLGGERRCESKVSCPRTQRSAPADALARITRSGVQRKNH